MMESFLVALAEEYNCYSKTLLEIQANGQFN